MGLNSRLPSKQSRAAQFAIKHPIQLALLSAALIGVLTYVIVGDFRAVAIAALPTAAIQWFLWRRNGPGRRREERLYDDDGNLR